MLGLHGVLPPTSYAKSSHTWIHAAQPSSSSASHHLAMISSTSAIAILFSLFSASICCYSFVQHMLNIFRAVTYPCQLWLLLLLWSKFDQEMKRKVFYDYLHNMFFLWCMRHCASWIRSHVGWQGHGMHPPLLGLVRKGLVRPFGWAWFFRQDRALWGDW